MTALPNIVSPTYLLDIPSTKQQVKYRPFTVAEEKVLMIAMQESGPDNLQIILNAIKQVVLNCTFGQLEIEKLTSYDLEFVFLELKKKSSGAKVDLAFTCKNDIALKDDEIVNKDGPKTRKCNTLNEIQLDLNEVAVSSTDPARSNKIMLTDTLGVILKDASLIDAVNLEKASEFERVYETAYRLVDSVFDGPTVFEIQSPQQLKEFIDRLPLDQFQKIRDFFETTPTLSTNIHIKCKGCGHEETIPLRGLRSFLG
jgi:hypothetical protein